MYQGTIKNFNLQKRVGFIKSDEYQKDVFLHISKIKEEDIKKMKTGLKVKFEAEIEKGQPKATELEIIKEEVPKPAVQKPAHRSIPPKKMGPNTNPVHNPYNFVRPLPAPVKENEMTKQPYVSLAAPSGFTGEIQVKATINSPVAFLGKEKPSGLMKDHRLYEFYKEGGKYTVPGSSLRGAVRSLFEAATNSCFSVLTENKEKNDFPLFYRESPDPKNPLVPARVTVNEKGTYSLEILNGKVDSPNSSRLQYAAWIFTYGSNSNKPASNPYEKRFQKKFSKYKHKEKMYAKLEKITHKRGFSFYSVEDIQPERPESGNYVEGYYFASGNNSRNKHDERFFFRDSSPAAVFPEFLPLEEKVKKGYEQLLRNYIDVNTDAEGKMKNSVGPEHSRHIEKRETSLQENDLVYAKLDKDCGEVISLHPVQLTRGQYKHSIQDLIGEHHEHLTSCNDAEGLCPACRVFGWVSETAVEDTASVRSRVSFTSGLLEDKSQAPGKYILRPLDKPKPTTSAFYLKRADGNTLTKEDNYNSKEVKISGRKFYLDHGRQKKENKLYEKYTTTPSKDIPASKLNSSVEAFDRGSFTFSVKFTNLQEAELGALLWSLQLEEGMNHHLGYGKPLGLGSVTMDVDKLLIEEDHDYLWDDDTLTVSEAETYVDSFKEKMREAYGKKFDILANTADLKAIHTPALENPIRYPSEVPFEKQFKWFMDNNKANVPQQLPDAAKQNDNTALRGANSNKKR
jgi:CRISPR-associated protein (TIGR03986 family)